MTDRPVPYVRPVTNLLRRILQLTECADFKMANDLGLSRGDFNAMAHLMSDEAMGPSELAHRLHITTSSATVLVDRLETMGHVVRLPDPGDRRRVVVEPTRSAENATWAILMPLIAAVDAAAADMSESNQRVVGDYLERVVAAYEEYLEGR